MNSYQYSIQNDFPQQQVNPDLLSVEILNSTIVTLFVHIDVAGDACIIWFNSTLSGPEETELDSLVAAHMPSGAPPSVVDLTSDVITDTVWATFKEYIDGTIANLYFYTQTYSSQYIITTDHHGGFRHRYILPFSDTADKTDFETNFLPNQNTTAPYEQLPFIEKSVDVILLPNGDIDRIETILGAKKEIKQFNYDVDDNFIGMTVTIVDV